MLGVSIARIVIWATKESPKSSANTIHSANESIRAQPRIPNIAVTPTETKLESKFSVRRSNRSASAPEKGASRITGPWVRNRPRPTQNEECVICSSCRLRTEDQCPASSVQRPASGGTGEVAEPEPAKTRIAERCQHAGASILPEVGTTVSRILTATRIPDPVVSTATVVIAAEKPAASAMTPATIAPSAYPASRHSR